MEPGHSFRRNEKMALLILGQLDIHPERIQGRAAISRSIRKALVSS
jgi:hypothetical protein